MKVQPKLKLKLKIPNRSADDNSSLKISLKMDDKKLVTISHLEEKN